MTSPVRYAAAAALRLPRPAPYHSLPANELSMRFRLTAAAAASQGVPAGLDIRVLVRPGRLTESETLTHDSLIKDVRTT